MEIIHEDPHLLVVNKPGGLPSQADKTGDPSLIDVLTGYQVSGPVLGLPHRLDRPVSGVVLLTRTPEALSAMNTLFAARAVRKTYWAIVSGTPPSSGTWKHQLVHDARMHKARVVDDASQDASVVAFERLAQGDRYALIQLVPEGGKFHQLRAQCAAAGFPIKGDVKYGARRGEPDRSIGLHARSIAFTHPFEHRPVEFIAAAPSAPLWNALLQLAGRPTGGAG